jgi:tetratricopeptide (TPR) repeat protein
VIWGLLAVHERMYNGEEFKRLSQELVDIDDSKKNRLIQVSGLINTGLISDADIKLQSYMEKYKDDPQAELLASEIALKQGRINDAIVLANKSLESDPGNYYAWYLRGLIYINKGDYSQAITDINKSRSIQDDIEARIDLARAYFYNDRQEDAKAELSAIVYEPTTPDKARFMLESILIQSGDKIELNNFYQEMINKFPNSVLWLSKVAGYSSTNKDYDVAQQLFKMAWEKSTQQNAPYPNALAGLLFTLVESKKYQDAIELAGQYVDSPFAHIAYIALGKVKKAQSDMQTAYDYFKKAADSVKDNPNQTYNILREMGVSLGVDKVRDYCREKIASGSEAIVPNYILSQLAVNDKDYNKALDFLDKCVDIAGTDQANVNFYYSQKANVLVKAYETTSDNSYLEGAINIWEELLKTNPQDISILNNLAYTLASNNEKLDKALKYAEKAKNLRPNNQSILDTYAYVLYINGRFEEAEQYAQSSIQLFEDKEAFAPVDVYEHLGMIKEKLEDVDGAIKAYNKALEVGGDTMPQIQTQRINDALLRIADL